MRKAVKRFLAGGLAAAMMCFSVISGTSLTVRAEEAGFHVAEAGEKNGSCGTTASWSLDGNGVMTITGSGTVTVFECGDAASVKSVVIEEGITGVDANVFDMFENLEKVQVPKSMTQINGALAESVVVYGYAGTYAEQFAAAKGCPFAALMAYPDAAKDDWGYPAIEYVHDNGIMTGMGNGYFGGYAYIPRAQFAVVLHRLEGAPEAEYKNCFYDVPDHAWYTTPIMWANQCGIVTGYSNGYFGFNDNITREQMAVMMYRYAKYRGYNTNAAADLSEFADVAKVDDFALEALGWAVGSGVITGKESGTKLDPLGYASRMECATIIMRFMEKICKKVEVSSITLSEERIELEAYRSVQLTAAVEPDMLNPIVLWKSGNNAVATVVNGKVTGVGRGITIVTAKSGEKEVNCVVKVTKVDVTGLDFDMSGVNTSMMPGESAQWKVNVTPSNASVPKENVTWSSSNPGVATVAKGVVTAIAPGIVTITAKLESCTCSYTITVKEPMDNNALAIKNYISWNGKVNTSGNKEISYSIYDSENDFTYTQILELVDGNSLRSTLWIDDIVEGWFELDLLTLSCPGSYYGIRGGYGSEYFSGFSNEFNIAAFTLNKDLHFMVLEANGVTIEDINNLGSVSAQINVMMLDLWLQETLGPSVRQLGFHSFIW